MADPVGPAAAEERRQAFDRVVVPEIQLLYRVAITLTSQPAEAEDLVQDTLLRAYRGLDGFDGVHARAWLLAILRNANISRNRRRRPGLLDDPAAADRGGDDGDRGPERLVLDQVFDAQVEAAFGALPAEQQAVIRLVDVHGLSYQEAADVLGTPVGTVMSRLHRGRTRIRRRLTAASGYGRWRR